MRRKLLLYFALFLSTVTAFSTEKCGLPELLMSKSALTLARPIRASYYDSEHFRVWFDTIGTHAVPLADTSPADGVPDWVQRACESLERARALLVDTLGFRAPIADSSIFPSRRGVGGDDRTDIYFTDMEFYGMTYLDTILVGGVGPAFLTIENDYEEASFPNYRGREEEALAVTCAHEFFHAIHYAYGSNTTWTWWMEATAVWAEERCFPFVNDYLAYLSSFQSTPEAGLNSNVPPGRLYGTCLFPMYISANYGDSAICAIWSNIPSNNVFQSISLWANSLGLNLKSFYGSFALWNLLVGENNRSLGYNDAALMPPPKVTHIDSLPSSLNAAGSAVYLKLASSTESGLWAELSSPDSLSAALFGLTPTGTDFCDTLLDIFNRADTIAGAWRYTSIFGVLGNLGPFPTQSSRIGRFVYGPAPLAKVPFPADIVDRTPFPNPFDYSTAETLYIPFSAGSDSPIRFSVWNSAGELVFERVGETSLGYHLTARGAMAWIPQNNSGRQLASGIYVYTLALRNFIFTGKFAIVNKS